MDHFRPADAALEGFRIGRENPIGLAIWTAVYFAATLLTGALMIKSGAAQGVQTFLELAMAGTPNSEALSATMQQAALPFFIAQWPMIVAQLLVQAAVLRIAFRPAAQKTYLRVSIDEVRMFAAFFLILLITMAATMAVSVVGGIVTAVVPPLGVMIVLLGSAAVWIFLSVRLLLLYPQALNEGSLDPRTAWEMTRQHFWPILGAQMMAFVFFCIVVVLGGIVASAIRLVGGAPERQGPITTMAALMSPGELGWMLVESLLQSLGVVLLIAPSIVIYQALKKTRV